MMPANVSSRGMMKLNRPGARPRPVQLSGITVEPANISPNEIPSLPYFRGFL